jgi:hypothetical protein
MHHLLRDVRRGSVSPICIRVRPTMTELSDPSAALLAALRRDHPGALPDSACEGGGPAGAIRVIASGQHALGLDLGPVEQVGPTAFKVRGGPLTSGGICTQEIEYSLQLDAGTWRVVSQKTLLYI